MSIDLRYYIAIDAAQADAELARLHKEATTAAGSQDRMAAATKATSAALKEEAAAAKQASSATSEVAASSTKASAAGLTFQQRIAKLPDLLGKQAAALSLVSSSMAGMGGEVGKLVAGAGQFAAAYGAGGPYAAALVAAVGLGNVFVEALHDIEKAQEDAFEKDFEKKYGAVLRATTRIKALKEEVVALNRAIDADNTSAGDLAALAESAIDKRREARRAENAAAGQESPEAFRAKLKEAEFLRLEAKAIDAKVDALQGVERRQQEVADAAEREANANKTTTLAQQARARVHAQNLEFYENEARIRREMDAPSTTTSLSDSMMGFDATKPTLATVLKQHESEALLREHKRQIANQKATNDEIERQAQDNYARRLQADADFNNGVADIAKQTTTIVATASGELIAGLIGGQEKALEQFGVSIMAQAGQALVSYGTQALGAAALSLSLGNLPGAAIQGATGAALIAGGTALGGVAANIGAGFNPSKGAAERGPSPRSSSSANTGPSTTAITYVFAPSRDEGAAAVAVAGKRASVRGFEKEKVR